MFVVNWHHTDAVSHHSLRRAIHFVNIDFDLQTCINNKPVGDLVRSLCDTGVSTFTCFEKFVCYDVSADVSKRRSTIRVEHVDALCSR